MENPSANNRWRPKLPPRIESEANPVNKLVIVNTATHDGPAKNWASYPRPV